MRGPKVTLQRGFRLPHGGRGWCRSPDFHLRGLGSNPQPVHLILVSESIESVQRRYSGLAALIPLAIARSLSLAKVARMSDEEATEAFRLIRWAETKGEAVCPRCGSLDNYAYKTRKLYRCKGCSHQFSVTSGTIFASRKLQVRDYLLAIAIFVNSANRPRPLDHFFKQPIRVVSISRKRHHQVPLPVLMLPKPSRRGDIVCRRVMKLLKLGFDLGFSDYRKRDHQKCSRS